MNMTRDFLHKCKIMRAKLAKIENVLSILNCTQCADYSESRVRTMQTVKHAQNSNIVLERREMNGTTPCFSANVMIASVIIQNNNNNNNGSMYRVCAVCNSLRAIIIRHKHNFFFSLFTFLVLLHLSRYSFVFSLRCRRHWRRRRRPHHRRSSPFACCRWHRRHHSAISETISTDVVT